MAKKINIVANLIDWQFKKQLKDLQNGKYNVNVNVNGTGLKNANAQMRQLGSSTQNTNTVFGKLRNTISNTFSSGKLAMTSYLVVLNEINKAAREAKDTILEMDKAVTDLSVAMNSTREEAGEYVKVLNKQAIELKTTTKSVTDASDAWLRQGKSIKETETLIRDSLVLSKVGKIESADATDYLTSALNGYKLEAEDAISVIDKLTAVDAESASEAGGLALSMSRTASAANMAGVSMDKLIGWLSVVKEVTRDSDEAVGNMAKTMLSRMNQVKAGKFIDAETGESLNDMEKTLSKVGIAMRDMNGQFISSEIVLDELGKKFNEFDSVTQRAIATQLGGTYQYEKVISLLSNYGDALKYAEISANSAGSAMQKFNESYMGSLEAAQAQLQASFDALVINTDFEEVYADILEATKGIVDFVNEVNLLKGVASGLAVTGLIKAFTAFKTGASEAYISLNQYQQALTLVNKTHISTNDFTRLLMLTKNLSASQTKLILSSKNLTLTQKKQLLMNQGLSASEAKLHLQNLKLTTSYTGLKGSMVSVTNACKGLFNTIKANPLMWITTLISGATMAWESHKQSVEEANERAITSAETAGELVSELSELTGKYLELSKAVETDASAKEDLLSTQETLLKKLELEGETVDTLISKYGSLSEAIRQTSIDTLRDAQIDLLAGIETAKTELEEVGKAYESWHSITSRNILSSSGKDAGRAYQVLEDAGLMSSGSHSDVAGQFVLTGDDSVEGILANYKLLEDALRALRESNEFTGEELTENPVYNQIHDRMKEMEEYVEQYKTLIDDYNNSLAQDTMLSSMGSMELPDTEDEFKKFREELIATAIESQKFIGTEEEIENAINAYLSTLPNFVGYYSGAVKTEVENVAGITEQELTKLFDKLTSSKDSLNTFISSVQSASEAYSNLMNPNISSADILSSIQSINEAVSSMGGSLDWEFIDKHENSLEILGGAIEHISRKYAESVLSGAGIDVNSKFGQMLANNIIQAQKASEQLSNLNTNIDSLQSAYSDLTDIVEAYNETGYLTFDQLQTLLELEPQYLQCLIDENGQLQLNEQAMVALANQRLNDAEAQAVQQAITELGQLALQDEKTAVEENAQAFTDAVDDLAGYNQELANTIAEATIGASAIRDLNAAIKGAESEGATDDQINTVLNNLETKLQAINNVRDKLNTGGLDSVMGGKKSSSDKDTSKEFDWIERAIDNIEKQISRLNKISDSAYSSAREKNKALADQIHLVNQEIALQQQAYEGYMSKANSIGLSDDYKNLVQAGAINIEKITDKELQDKISAYQEYYDKAQETQDKINDLYEQSNDYHVSAYELHLEKLDRLRDNQSISEREYLNRKQQLYIKYYNDNVKLAEIAHEKKLELLNEEKEYLQSVANSAIDILGERTDALEDARDNIISDYESQIDALEAQKKPLEDQLEMLEKEHEEQELILNLQKAQFELERARSQRNKLVYQNGQMTYVADDKAIKEKADDVDNAKLELTKFNIQQEIDLIDDQIDKLNELIDSTNKYYDNEIDKLGKLQSEWEKALSLEERSINRVNFTSMFGEGSIDKLLAGDLSQITKWKEQYSGVLKDIDLTNDGVIGDVAKEFSTLANVDLSKTTSQTQAVIDQYETLKTSVGDTTSAIGVSASGEQSEDKSKAENVEGKEESSSTLIGAMEESYVVAEETLPAEAEMFYNIASSVQSATNAVYEYKSAIESLGSASSSVPVTPHAEGTVGKAFASGTGNYKGLAHAEKNALRSEYGQPELTVYPDGTTELTTEPTMSDLPRNTVIFNEEQTKRIMNNEGTVIGNAHADGNAVLQKASTPSYLRPIQEGDKGYELIKAARVYQDMLKTNIMLPVNSIDKNVEMMTRNISNVSTNNVNKPTLTINGGINVSCPGVNSQEIMNQVKTAMHREIGGIALEALQEASITR